MDPCTANISLPVPVPLLPPQRNGDARGGPSHHADNLSRENSRAQGGKGGREEHISGIREGGSKLASEAGLRESSVSSSLVLRPRSLLG